MGVVTLLGQSTGGESEIFFVTVARRMGFGSVSVVVGGGFILTGLVAGSIFVGITARVSQLGLTNVHKAITIGFGAGIAIWIVFYLPVTAIFTPESLNGLVIGSLRTPVPIMSVAPGTAAVGFVEFALEYQEIGAEEDAYNDDCDGCRQCHAGGSGSI